MTVLEEELVPDTTDISENQLEGTPLLHSDMLGFSGGCCQRRVLGLSLGLLRIATHAQSMQKSARRGLNAREGASGGNPGLGDALIQSLTESVATVVAGTRVSGGCQGLCVAGSRWRAASLREAQGG